MLPLTLFNEDCLTGASKIPSNSIDLMICDPPFGIHESSFDQLYHRQKESILQGYVEAPTDYYDWSLAWMTEAKRILKERGSFYVISGWTKLRDVLNAAEVLKLQLINHLIWKFNFGIFTHNKYVSSHYHILYYSKGKLVTFNDHCRYGSQEKGEHGEALQYKDMEDVWNIKKEYHVGQTKNKNKLPDELIKKIVLYSSNKDDLVCDFFMGNFTTAYVALGLGRKVIGFEINAESFNYHKPLLEKVEYGYLLNGLKSVQDERPKHQGKPITEQDLAMVKKDYWQMKNDKKLEKDIVTALQEKYERGKFSITNIIKKIKNKGKNG
jgi:site-specific DNA-methyltransferase (adenine-specific)